ncbi:MAG TPA: ABC transporter permease [Stellaceae bacterium]|nr:ABC transporter permease [Stellaceae bacterium]
MAAVETRLPVRRAEGVADAAAPAEADEWDHGDAPAVTQDAAALRAERLAATARSWGLRTAAILAGIGLWYWAAKVHLDLYIRFTNVPTPVTVAEALWRHLHEPKFYMHIAVSMARITGGYTLASVVGIFLGLIMGRWRLARDLLVPYIELLRPIPAVAWIPLAILMWPTEESSIIYITFLGALFPIVLNTIHGVEQTPEVLVRAAQSLGASRFAIFWHVVIPAALPSIAAGLAIGMGVSWFSLLAGEIISGQYGIGYFTWNAYSLINYPDIVVGMLMIGLLGTLSTYAVRLLTRPLLAWQRRGRS